MRILITGGAGFLGSHLCDRLIDQGHEVICLDNFFTGTKDNSADLMGQPHFELLRHDVTFPLYVEVDEIYNLACPASPVHYQFDPVQTTKTSVHGAINMLGLAKRTRAKILQASTSEVYGDPEVHPQVEDYRGNVNPIGPRACYDESKRVGETLCYIFHTKHGTHTNVIRPFNVFGPGMQETDYRVLPNFASRIKAGQPLKVYGSGNQTRTFCYITDAMVGFLNVVLGGVAGEAYNIGNPKPEISMVELVKTMERLLGCGLDYDVIEYPDSYPADEPNRRAPDIRKAKTQLKFVPEVTLEDGLQRFLSWSDEYFTGRE